MSKFCSQCGAQLSDDIRYCVNCCAACEGAEPVYSRDPVSEPEPESFSAPDIRAGSRRQGGPVTEDATFDVPPLPPAKQRKSRAGLIAGISVGALLLVGVGAFFLFFSPFKKDDAPASKPPEETAATEEATLQTLTQLSTDAVTELSTTAPTVPPTAAPTAAPTQPTMPSPIVPTVDGGADSIRGVIDTAFDNYYFRTRDLDRYLSVMFEYCYAATDSYRQSIYNSYEAKFRDLTELNDLEDQYGADMVIQYTVTDTKTLTGKELNDAIDAFAGNCDARVIEQVVYVTFTTEVSGAKKTEKGLWHGYFFRVEGRWYTNLEFI